MLLRQLHLQNFRSYSKATFDFTKNTTVIVGPNTSGKTNLIEAIYLLSFGKSFHADKDRQLVSFGKQIARVKGFIKQGGEETQLEVMLAIQEDKMAPLKKYLINGVPKRRADFMGNLSVVLFSPLDIDIIANSPSTRRRFLDEVLEQTDREYRIALLDYTKALRQRNALLEVVRKNLPAGRQGNEKQFEYWDHLLIKTGHTITQKRASFIEFLNTFDKTVFDFAAFYDKSVMSAERLLQYRDAEIGSGVTLVGPHRDDFSISMYDNKEQTTHDMKLYASRGQQRLAVLELKMLQLAFMEKNLRKKPLLLLDDIFSELDESHIELVISMIGDQQTILTTTHKEFLGKKTLKDMTVIELKDQNA